MAIESAPVTESDEATLGLILDYDVCEDIVSIEVLRASKRTDDPGWGDALPAWSTWEVVARTGLAAARSFGEHFAQHREQRHGVDAAGAAYQPLDR